LDLNAVIITVSLARQQHIKKRGGEPAETIDRCQTTSGFFPFSPFLPFGVFFFFGTGFFVLAQMRRKI